MTEEEKKEDLQSRIDDLVSQVSSFNIKEKRNVGFVFNSYMLLHENDRGHPERPSRLMSIYTHLENKAFLQRLVPVKCPKLDPEVLELVHEKSYIDYVIKSSKERKEDEGSLMIAGDVFVNQYSSDAALISAGGTIAGLKVMAGEKPLCSAVFAAVRPPGHHACANEAAGFCFFNNVAVAAKYAQKNLGFKKICIFDWDVHAGDGTSRLFLKDDSILLISIHRYDDGRFYPGPYGTPKLLGEEQGLGFNVFFGFSTKDQNKNGKVGDYDYIYACHNLLFPIVQEFNPDLILVSSGFDSALGDPLGQIGVTPFGYAWMVQGLKQIKDKVQVVLEGGYNLESLAVSAEAVVKSLLIAPDKVEEMNQMLAHYDKEYNDVDAKDLNVFNAACVRAEDRARESFKELTETLGQSLAPYWNCLKDRFEKTKQ